MTRIPLRLVLFVLLLETAVASAAETLTVRLASGRTFTAEVDERTNDAALWLRFGDSGALLLRPIEWSRITGAEHAGRAIAAGELRATAERLKSPAPAALVLPENTAVPGAPPQAEQARAWLGFAPRVSAVTFDAGIANWDADVEADGLILHVLPLAADGSVVPSDGLVEVTLTTLDRRDFSNLAQGRGESFERTARWAQPIRAADCGPNGAVLKLPFQSVHPEFDPRVSSIGLVNVRLTVPGVGVFDDSLDGVRVRPYAPLRDALERARGQRFFPHERTGR